MPRARVPTMMAENMNGPWWKIKKIISGKINNALSNDSHLYRGGGGNKNITYGPPVILYTGSFEPNHATGLLHETVDFKKNQQDFTAVLVKLQNAYGRKQHNSSHLSA